MYDESLYAFKALRAGSLRPPHERPEDEEGYPERERYWLEQLRTFDRFPVLSIIGAKHFDSFRDLTTQSGFEAVEVVRDWVPSDFVKMRS